MIFVVQHGRILGTIIFPAFSLSLLKYYEAIASSLHFLVISLIICQHISHQVLCFRPIYFISFLTFLIQLTVFPDGSVGKEYACNVGDMGDVGLIGGFVRSPGEGNGNPLQYSCLGNPKDRGTRWATVQRVKKLWPQQGD